MILSWKKKHPVKRYDRLAHERLISLINSMADAVIAVDQQTRIVAFNAAALNILDRNDAMEHHYLSDVFHPIGKDNKPIAITDLVKGVTVPTTSRDMRLKYGDDSTVNLYVSIAPVRLSYGQRGQQGYVILLRDITREKSLEEERDEFISVASHELRTPIAIMEGNISNAMFIADKTGNMEQIKTALKNSHNQVLFLADLVNDLSMLSRAERGAMPVDVGPVDVPALIDEVLHNYREQATAKGLSIDANVHVRPGYEFVSSKLYIREILQNFVTNAIKYTEEGSVTITAQTSKDGVTFVVSDTGIGISRSDQQHVFEKFFRSGDFRTTKATGTGLGLYVTAKLARLLSAEITLESTLNEGTTVSIDIPTMPLPKEQTTANDRT
jgi:two-component system, OmpR family, phosphate regulon sensor histidine kinase PhoR